MKNQHILPNTRVPKETRLEVYKEALELVSKVIKNQDTEKKFKDLGAGLCLVLPCLLWGLDRFLDNFTTIDNKQLPWNFTDSSNMFPELTEELIDSIPYAKLEGNLRRKEVLISIIEEMENKTL